ncbi:SWIM zinc finger family protein [Clostridium sp.]|uniref:SWIM zinc finger family protein n=1 Tax=Clostridium sp. TaxID=1506 RepID=UPI002FDF0291
MNLNNFKNHIDKKILDRGCAYYDAGNILETYSQGNNEYIFQIQGSKDYKVVVKLDDMGEILYSQCDCPYEFGLVCKHEAAAYFQLYDILNNEDNIKSIKKETVNQPTFKEVLDNISKDELIKIIIDITEKDKILKNSIIVRYSKGNHKQELERCKNLIDSIVRKYTGRERFIKYSETYGFVSDMEDLLGKIKNTEDILLALDIAFLLFNEAVEAFQYADDSNGEIGSLVNETIDMIKEIVMKIDISNINLREKVFNKILEESNNEVFGGWDEYKIEMLRLCTEFADVEEFREKLREKIEYLLNKNLNKEYGKYMNESMMRILFDMIKKYGTKKEEDNFIRDNRVFTYFRELLINKYIKEKNYHKVIELALEGEKQDKQYRGLISTWKKIRYTAYKDLSLKEEQFKLAKELLLHGDFEYYDELKELAAGDKEILYNNLKQELKNDRNGYGTSIYLKLIVEKNDLDEIMEFVRKNPTSIERYADMLVNKFKDDVIDIYSKHIKSSASFSSNRKDYQRVCEILKRYKKIAGEEKQKGMINELNVLYRKRPAFVDELNKIR